MIFYWFFSFFTVVVCLLDFCSISPYSEILYEALTDWSMHYLPYFKYYELFLWIFDRYMKWNYVYFLHIFYIFLKIFLSDSDYKILLSQKSAYAPVYWCTVHWGILNFGTICKFFILLLFWIFLQDVSINEKVDVIVSEWMGYMLLYEVCMLGSVTIYYFQFSTLI